MPNSKKKDLIPMEGWAFLMQAYDDLEAGIVCGLLEAAAIPARRQEHDPLAGGMRVITGQAYEIDIYVPAPLLPRARAILVEAESRENPGSET